MPRKRILIVVIDLDGGVGVFCRNLAAGLKQFYPGEFELTLLLLRPGTTGESDRGLFDRIVTLDVAVHDDWRRFVETVPTARRLKEAIGSIESDLIFAVHNHPNLLVPLVAPRRRIILSVHGHLSTLLRRSVTRPVLRWLIRQRYGKHLVVVPTQGVADDLAGNFNITHTKVIPHGVDIERVQRLMGEPVADIPTAPYIIAVGRLVREKDYPTLLRGFALAKERGIPHRLVIVGGGEERAELEALAESLGISSSVSLLGQRDNPYAYLAHANFFVLSSISEGFGLALVEALAAGLACIATDCPSGPAEILGGGEFGVLVPPGSPAALADAITKLATAPDARAALASRARERAAEFSLEKMARNYSELFRSSSS